MIAVTEWMIIARINIYHKEAVIQRWTLTYGTANKSSPGAKVSIHASLTDISGSNLDSRGHHFPLGKF
jgi:hypothetical protein